MPRFNSRGDWCSGVGGDGVYLTVNGLQVDPGPGGAGDWLTDDEIVCVRWTTFADFRVVAISHTGTHRLLRSGVVNRAYAGGGRWGTAEVDGSFRLDDGMVVPPIVSFGRDGSLTTWIDRARGGLVIAGTTVSEAVVYESHVLDAHTGIWIEPDGPHTIGMPAPQLLPGPVHGLRVAYDGQQWWAQYVSESNGQLVLHPFDSFIGYALTQPFDPHNSETWAYRPDVVAIHGTLHSIWATIESELLGQIRGPVTPQDEARFSLRDLSAPVPPPIVVPPPPEPKPMSGITDAQFATLVSVRAKYGETLDEKQIGALLNEVAWIHRSEGVGMQSKNAGTIAVQPKTGLTIWRGMRFAGHIGQDVLGQASIGKCIPTRGTAGPADPNTFVAPVEPEGGAVIVPTPVPVPVPTPTPTPTPSGDYEARIHLLEQTVSRILSVMHSV